MCQNQEEVSSEPQKSCWRRVFWTNENTSAKILKLEYDWNVPRNIKGVPEMNQEPGNQGG